MKRTVFQHPELRDANDNIIQQGAFGKNTALANSTNDGWIDYVANDLMYLYNNTMGGTGGEINTETITGKTGTITNLTATTVKADTLTADALNGPLTGNVTGDLTGNVTGDVTGNLTGNVTGTADKATSDAAGNNIQTTYAKKSDLSSSLSTTSLTVSGETSVPTANAGNSSKAIANTAYVQGELTNYLPLSGGTLTGVVNGVTPPKGDNSKKLATTEFVDAKARNYLPLSGGTMRETITTTANPGLKVRDNDSYLVLCGASSHEHGAHMLLNGKNRPNYEGTFSIVANDGSGGYVALIGKPDGTLTWGNQPLLPVGIVQAFAGSKIPTGWLLCDGSAVSRTNYANLFKVIGTTYGAGNGSTTFNLPNLVNRMVVGSGSSYAIAATGGEEKHKLTTDEMPSHSHTLNRNSNTGTESWCLIDHQGVTKWQTGNVGATGGDTPHNNMPPYLALRYIIKY